MELGLASYKELEVQRKTWAMPLHYTSQILHMKLTLILVKLVLAFGFLYYNLADKLQFTNYTFDKHSLDWLHVNLKALGVVPIFLTLCGTSFTKHKILPSDYPLLVA